MAKAIYSDEARRSDMGKGKEDHSHLHSFDPRHDPDLHDMSHAPLARLGCEWCLGHGYVYGACITRHGVRRFKTSVEFLGLEFLDPRYSYAKFPEVLRQIYINAVMCPCKWPRHRPIVGIHFRHGQDADLWLDRQRCPQDMREINATVSKSNNLPVSAITAACEKAWLF